MNRNGPGPRRYRQIPLELVIHGVRKGGRLAEWSIRMNGGLVAEPEVRDLRGVKQIRVEIVLPRR